MPIEPFQIVNQDGTINQVEYQRCIEFLEQFVQGLIPVYASMTWNNPFEVDLTQQHSSLYILRDIMTNPTNRLLTKSATDHIVNLFKATVSGLSRPFIMSYEQIKSSGDWGLPDSPGYCFDEALQDFDHQVYFEDCYPAFTTERQLDSLAYNTFFHVAWKNDEYHTTISLAPRISNIGSSRWDYYSDGDSYRYFPSPTERLQSLGDVDIMNDTTLRYKSQKSSTILAGNLLWLWTHPRSHFYKQGAALYYLSECKDPMMSSISNWYEGRINTQMTVKTAGALNISNFGRGIPFDSLKSYSQEPTFDIGLAFNKCAGRAYVSMDSGTSSLLSKLYSIHT